MIRARVNPAVKARVEGIFATLGLSASDAIRLFCSQAVLRRGPPFEVMIPNALTQTTLKDATACKNLTRCASVDDLFRDLDIRWQRRSD